MGAVPLVVDLGERSVLADPAPLYRRLRQEEGPVRTGDGHIVLSRYDQVRPALADHGRFSSADTNGATRRTLPVLVGSDPPEHTRLRRSASSWFTATARQAWAPRVEARVEEVVNKAVGAGRVEAVESLCTAVPRAVLSELMGIDDAELAWLLHESPSRWRVGRQESFGDFFTGHLQRRIAKPGVDLLSTLAAAPDGTRLSTEEAVAFCILLTAAGTDSVRDLLANVLHEGARDPELWDRLCDATVLADALTDEAVRHVSPVQAVFRTVAPTTGAGPGERVVLLIGAANRDETRWERPDELLPRRYASVPAPTAHLGFGAGVHTCLGLALARIEVGVVMRTLSEAKVRPLPDGEIVRGRVPWFRTVKRLPLRLIR